MIFHSSPICPMGFSPAPHVSPVAKRLEALGARAFHHSDVVLQQSDALIDPGIAEEIAIVNGY